LGLAQRCKCLVAIVLLCTLEPHLIKEGVRPDRWLRKGESESKYIIAEHYNVIKRQENV